MSDTSEQARDAWSGALPFVLALMGPRRRELFRHELQRLLAFARFEPTRARDLAPALRALLLQSLRAAQQPAAIHATRQLPEDLHELVGLCEHLLACWRDAESAAENGAPSQGSPDGMSGEVFFGERLGGPGRKRI